MLLDLEVKKEMVAQIKKNRQTAQHTHPGGRLRERTQKNQGEIQRGGTNM